MFLLIDQGNSRLKYQLVSLSGEILETSLVVNDGYIPGFLPVDGVLGVVISQTGRLVFEPEDIFIRSTVHYISAGDFPEIKWAYPDLKQMGKDRIAGIAGAFHQFPGKNLMVADAGTCLTVDILHADGRHSGGYISPGLRMRLQAMHHFTDALPEVGFSHPLRLLPGENTSECMQSGALAGIIGEIDFHFSNMQYFDSQDFVCIISGGDAEDLAHHLKQSTFVAHDLVFQGLLQAALRL